MVWSYSSLPLTKLHVNCLTFLCHLCLKGVHTIYSITENSQSGQSGLTTRAKQILSSLSASVNSLPNGLEWPPTANGDSIISEFHGLCTALLHHCKDLLLKGKSLTGHENSVLSIKLVGRGRNMVWRSINIHSVLSQ